MAHHAASLDCVQLGKCFGLLSLPMRLRIVLLLSQEERSVSALTEQLKVPQPTVSHHLGVLRAGGAVASRRAGKQVFYRLSGAGAGGGAVTVYAVGYWIRLTIGRATSPDA